MDRFFFFSFLQFIEKKVKLLRTPRNSRCHIDFYFLPNACIHFLPIHRPTNSSRSTRLAYIQRSTWRDSPCPNYKLRHRRPLCCEPKSILLNMLNEKFRDDEKGWEKKGGGMEREGKIANASHTIRWWTERLKYRGSRRMRKLPFSSETQVHWLSVRCRFRLIIA